MQRAAGGVCIWRRHRLELVCLDAAAITITCLAAGLVVLVAPARSLASDAATFVSLGDLPGGDFHSVAWGVSPEGSVVVGMSNSLAGPEAFRWEDGVMAGLEEPRF